MNPDLKKILVKLKEHWNKSDDVQVEMSRLGPLTQAALFFEKEDVSISSKVYCGLDRNPDLALFKAAMEAIERLTIYHQRKNQLISAGPLENSDGFAAYPIFGNTLEAKNVARSMARTNALCEAIERYAWANWWDNPNAAFTLTNSPNLSPEGKAILDSLNTITGIGEIILVRPLLENNFYSVLIYFARLIGGGMISGGACGDVTNEATTQMRALGELARHGVAIKRLKERKAQTFYEQRLCFFATSEGEEKFNQRILQQSIDEDKPLSLRELNIDCEVAGPFEDFSVVYRCYFKGQPSFLGGAIERFCI